MNEITKTERSEYRQLLKSVKAWVADAQATAGALRRIRDNKLFRADNYASFAEFCREELGYTPQWANQIIRSAEATARISETIVSEKLAPANEAQARELSKAPEEQQAEVWSEVVEEHGDDVTAAKVSEAVERRKAPKNGSPVVSHKDRSRAEKLVGDLIRLLCDLGVYQQLRQQLNDVAEVVKRV